MLRQMGGVQPYNYSNARNVYAFEDFGFGNIPVVQLRRDNDGVFQDFTALEIANGDDITWAGGNIATAKIIYDHIGNNDAIATGNGYKFIENNQHFISYGKPALSSEGGQYYDTSLSNSKYSQFYATFNSSNDLSTVLRFSGAVVLRSKSYTQATFTDIDFSNTQGLFSVDFINVAGYLNGVDETGSVTTMRDTFNRQWLLSDSSILFSNYVVYDFSFDNSSDRTLIEADINNKYNNLIF